MTVPLLPAPFYVLIVAKTHMGNGFCIGGIAQNGRSVRLCRPIHTKVENYNQEYNIGDVWRIEEYDIPYKLTPPHNEDINVLYSKWTKPADHLLHSIAQFMPPVVGGSDALFEGMVQRAANGRLYIGHEAVPSYSTLFWRPDRDLRFVETLGGKSRYVYSSDDGDCFFSYVGIENAKAILPAGTLIRVSLARWWKPDDEPQQDEACYLQVSGWFDEAGDVGTHAPDELGSDDTSLSVTQASPTVTRAPVEADVHDLLKRHFGFEEFRPYQREIIESVLARRDTLVIMSTGAGKSLCYQLPALAFRGLTVVISPLISLMQDQVTHLESYGIPAATLNSHTDPVTRNHIVRQIQEGKVKLLYLSPERLVMPDTIALLQGANVECLVVDEAHCISQWGHDFRTEYREIVHVRRKLGDVPILAVTATATAQVRQDIEANLRLRAANKFIAPFNRPNLFLAVQPRHNGLQQVRDFLAQHEGQAGIIYCLTKKTVDELAAQLQQQGIHALPYHAGLDQATRQQHQHRFVREDAVVMVATVAFGMGIDKPDIRFVLHYNLAGDPEGYYQQIGRAGRDGDRADCLLLHAPNDFSTIAFINAQDDPQLAAQAAARLQHMKAWVKEFTCRRKWLLEYFGESDAPDNCGMCDACVVEAGSQAVADSDNITAYAALFLNCVKQVRQKFGREHIIGVLCGSRAQKLLSWKHDQLAAYGQGNALSRSAWKELAAQFFQLGLLTTNDVGAIQLTNRGEAVLKGEEVFGYFKRRPRSTASPMSEVGDAALFEKLRVLRRELADARGVPAFVIFSDRALRDMASRQPQTPAEFLTMHGVGEHKSAEFGEVFLEVIRGHEGEPRADQTAASTSDTGKPTTSKAAAHERRAIAMAALQAGKSLEEAAEACGVQPATVMRYIFRHYREEGALPSGVTLPQAEVSTETRAQVFAQFDQRGVDELGPTYWVLDQRVDYLDLDLLRLEYLQRVAMGMDTAIDKRGTV